MTRTEIQDKIIEELPLKPHGLLKFAPRVGKSRIICETIRRNNPKRILWVTESTELRDVDIPKEVEKWIGKRFVNRVETICYQSLSKLEGKYDMIILDEYQNITDINTTNLLNGKIKYEYIIGATGTHPKHRYKNMLLAELELFELGSISIDEAVDLNLIAPYTITTVPVKLDSTDKYVLAGSKAKPFYQTEKASYEYLTKKIAELELKMEETGFLRIKRRKLILETRSKIKAAQEFIRGLSGRTMVFSGSIDISKNFSEYLYNSKTDTKYLNMFKNGEIDTLSVVNSGGTGHTYEKVDNFVVVQVDSNQKGNTTQKIARSLLEQGDYKANIYLFYLQDTVDEEWKNKVISEFNSDRIIEMKKIE